MRVIYYEASQFPDIPEDTAEQLALLEQARLEQPEATIHQLPIPARHVLAVYGEYTTTHQRMPEGFLRFLQHMDTVRMLGQLATNIREVMLAVDGYEDATDEMGTRLAAAFAPVTAIHGEGIDVIDPVIKDGEVVDGTITVEELVYSVPGEAAAIGLAKVLQALLRTDRLGRVLLATHGTDKQRGDVVKVRGRINEYDLRGVGAGVSALIAEEDARLEPPVVLPLDKQPLSFWEEEGETFPPHIKARLEATKAAYIALTAHLSASYPGRDDIRPAIIHHEPLGNEPAAAFEAARKLINGLGHFFRGGSHKNKEQNPNKADRLSIERGVELRRDPSDPTAKWHGPKPARSRTTAEKIQDYRQKTLQELRNNWLHTGIKLAIKGTSAALGSIAEVTVQVTELLIDHTPHAKTYVKLLISDYHEWQRQKQKARQDSTRIDTAIAKLRTICENAAQDPAPPTT